VDSTGVMACTGDAVASVSTACTVDYTGAMGRTGDAVGAISAIDATG